MKIINKIDVVVHILHKNINEEIAFDLEAWYIHEYIFNYGYDLCNVCFGGEGASYPSSKKGIGKKVICINTGKVFNNSREAGEFYKIEASDIRRCCSYENYYAGKLQSECVKWMYLDEFLTNVSMREKILHENYVYNSLYKSKEVEVICVTTGEKFNSIKLAQQKYKDASHISTCCKGKRKSSGKLNDGTKLIWKYL